MKRIAIFLDGANFFYTQRKLGWYIDTERLLDHCRNYGQMWPYSVAIWIFYRQIR